jgi:hypothetical protein
MERTARTDRSRTDDKEDATARNSLETHGGRTDAGTQEKDFASEARPTAFARFIDGAGFECLLELQRANASAQGVPVVRLLSRQAGGRGRS